MPDPADIELDTDEFVCRICGTRTVNHPKMWLGECAECVERDEADVPELCDEPGCGTVIDIERLPDHMLYDESPLYCFDHAKDHTDA